MLQIENVPFFDNTGNQYTFKCYPTGTRLDPIAGVYAFTRINSNGKHDVLYIGETQSFLDRPLGWGHEKWDMATRMGLTHICVMQTSNRVTVQNRLIAVYDPPLNKI